eukprot:COSAG05_NODE_348_length_10944_cov_10.258368_11_plen_51_part_00
MRLLTAVDAQLLDVVRSSLLADPSLAPKMPAEWVFVKKGAPVGKKAVGNP